MGFIADYFTGKRAQKATERATDAQMKAQQEALDYLKQTEAAPQFYREQALGSLAGLYGLQPYQDESAEGVPGQQADISSLIEQNPLYQGIMSGIGAGEEAILRNASATGGLRSGNVQSNLADFSSQIQNQATMAGYQDVLGGLNAMAGLPSYAPQIAQGTAGIGQTRAQGILGKEQVFQDMYSNISQQPAQYAQLFMQAFSDIRLKSDVKRIGDKNGFGYYKWKWNDKARELGLEGEAEGYMAHEVAEARPEAVSESHGYLTVNEGMLNG